MNNASGNAHIISVTLLAAPRYLGSNLPVSAALLAASSPLAGSGPSLTCADAEGLPIASCSSAPTESRERLALKPRGFGGWLLASRVLGRTMHLAKTSLGLGPALNIDTSSQ